MEALKRLGIPLHRVPAQEAALFSTACLYVLMERMISDYLRPHQLTPAKFNAMMIIKHIGKDQGMSQIEIGKRLIVSASNMTRLLDKLQKDGCIERIGRLNDRRVNLVRITEKGSGLLDAVWPGYYETVSSIANVMNKEELTQLVSMVGKWCDKLERETASHV